MKKKKNLYSTVRSVASTIVLCGIKLQRQNPGRKIACELLGAYKVKIVEEDRVFIYYITYGVNY